MESPSGPARYHAHKTATANVVEIYLWTTNLSHSQYDERLHPARFVAGSCSPAATVWSVGTSVMQSSYRPCGVTFIATPDRGRRTVDSARRIGVLGAPAPRASSTIWNRCSTCGHAGCTAAGQKARPTMTKSSRKLTVNKQTLRVLVADELADVAGGWIRPMITVSCPQPAPSSSNCPKL